MAALRKAAIGLIVLMALNVSAQPHGTTEKSFSFEQWVDDIINKQGEPLSPEEAWKAAVQSLPATDDDAKLSKRTIVCGGEKGPAAGLEAVQCMNQLAAPSDVGCPAYTWQSSNLCSIGNAQVWGEKSTSANTGSPCHDVAKTVASILDACWNDAGQDVMGSAQVETNRHGWVIHLSTPTAA